jgi:hypothetical protein
LADQPSRVSHENLEQVPFGGSQSHRLTAAGHGLASKVDGKRANGDRRLVVFNSCATEGGAQAGE